MSYEAYRRDDYNALSETEFRTLVRGFLEENHPPELRNRPERLPWAEAKPLFMILSQVGWLAPAWPRRYGGMGLNAAQQLNYMSEYERFGAARFGEFGTMLMGPLLINYGTAAQQEHYLPRILSGEDVWCQGYSEPNAGSDLAALRTEARLVDDQWVVNGQKIWTTLAGDANWIFALVRTDNRGKKKQEGISFLLIAMDTPGITIRPIRNLALQDEFFEIFFDDVRVPKANLVGEVNQGWTMAKNLLGFERIATGSPGKTTGALAQLHRLAIHYGITEEPDFLRRYTDFRLQLADHECLFGRIADQLRRGEALGAEVSMLKLNVTQLFQRIAEYAVEIAGQDGAMLTPIDGNRDLNPMGQFFMSRPTTVYGGSSEVQRNILAKTLLGLP